MRLFLIAGNWKMNGGPAEAQKLLTSLKGNLSNGVEEVEALVCPPSVSLTTAAGILDGSAIKLGAQNVHSKDNGAYTGEVSTQMLAEAGCEYVIVGHSERREYFGETDEVVNAKTHKIIDAGLKPIICVGETLDQRKENVHAEVVEKQVQAALSGVDGEAAQQVVIAYEPIWAIGTGETATPEQAQEMHKLIRSVLETAYDHEVADTTRILYGGSMKPHNAQELLQQPDVDGGLVGGASLKADSFAEIIEIAGGL